MHMRTTVDLNEDLISKARELTGITEKTALIHLSLRTLIERETGKRLSQLGGTMPGLRDVPRRKAVAK